MSFTFTPVVPAAFHNYFSGFNRIEPRCRSDHATAGLEARTADPLWFLGRAWQFGEFRAEDAGSPVGVEIAYRAARLRELRLVRPDGSSAPPVSLTAPLETMVEREPVLWENDWRQRVRVGLQFERLCRKQLGTAAAATVITTCRTSFGVQAVTTRDDREKTDRATQRYRRLMAGKVVDGWRVWFAPDNQLPQGAGPVVIALRDWWRSLYSEPDSTNQGVAWQPEQLDYHFAAAAPLGDARGEVVLGAPSYRNGDFDWHSCRVDKDPATWDGGTAAAGADLRTQKYAPARVTYGGMPLPRYWAFEDSRVDFGALDVTTCDVAKMALAEFALIFGDDWFMVPLELPVGACARISQLTVRNVFGETVAVLPARTPGATRTARWQMYVLNRAAPQLGFADFLFVPPAVGFRDESEPLEEVRFIRDEGANTVWGVETLVPNRLGAPWDGFEAQLEARARKQEQAGQAGGTSVAATPAPGGAPSVNYKFATPVPANWIPFVPADALVKLGTLFRPGRASVRLLRAQMLTNESQNAPVAIDAQTRLLDVSSRNPNPLRWLDEEAVPREGVRVQLTRQRVRWTDGKTYVWLGKKVVVGRGEGSSGLRFDVVK